MPLLTSIEADCLGMMHTLPRLSQISPLFEAQKAIYVNRLDRIEGIFLSLIYGFCHSFLDTANRFHPKNMHMWNGWGFESQLDDDE